MENTNQYLTFTVHGEEYAITVTHIREVLEVPKLTVIPRMPDFMRGIINLRGSVVPVLDLSSKFGLGETEFNPGTAIIVTEIPSGEGDELLNIGLLADTVHKVIGIEATQIEPPPRIGLAINTAFIQGMGRVDDAFVVILNVQKLLTTDELTSVENANHDATTDIAVPEEASVGDVPLET